MHFYRFAGLDSTQRYLLEHPPTARPVVCVADAQHGGIGQRGARWHSPVGGLYFSLRYPLPHRGEYNGGLAQAVALAIVQTLDPPAAFLQLKWPNDLYLRGKKLGGILIDMLPQAQGCDAVIGIGINLRPQQQFAHLPEAPAPDALLAQLLPPLFALLTRWETQPYLAPDHRWDDYDCYAHRTLRLHNRPETVQNFGIDQKGRLLVRTGDGIQALDDTRILRAQD